MDEVIKDAKNKKRTANITFFDLEDAFCSIPHELINHTLSRNNFPQKLQEYFKTFYSNIESKVITSKFQTKSFKFKRGVPIIFILAFNPIIEFILKQENNGYDLNGQRIITFPYANAYSEWL